MIAPCKYWRWPCRGGCAALAFERHAQCWCTQAVLRNTDDAAGEVTLVRLLRGKECRMWSAIAHGHAEALRGANHDIGSHRAGVFQQRKRHQISGYHDLRIVRLGLFNHRCQIRNHAFAVRVLEQDAKHIRHRIQYHARARNHFNSTPKYFARVLSKANVCG